MALRSSIPTWNVKNQSIVLRTDYNVPLVDGTIVDDFRLLQSLPTIDYLLSQGASSICIITHIGRPAQPQPALSTTHLVAWFIKKGYTAHHAATIGEAQTLSKNSNQALIILENIRFFPQESTGSADFARQLAVLGAYYVNDAFGTMHRKDSSVALLPYQYDEHHRSVGFLVEKEIAHLEPLITAPARPYVGIIGGGKAEDKLTLINALLDHVDTLVLCPGIVLPFFNADDQLHALCIKIQDKAAEKKVTLLFPSDLVVVEDDQWNALKTVSTQLATPTMLPLSIGPSTLDTLAPLIAQAGSIFFNGMMGFEEHPTSLIIMDKLIHMIAQSPAHTVIAGGNSVGRARALHVEGKISHLSTGGGATLTFLGGKKLNGLEPFK